jgi:sialate O-acetylesterase
MRVWFDSANGLTSHGKPLDGFELAGDDRHFSPATAMIEGSTVKVTAASIPSPRFVRYNWNSVTPPALYNESHCLLQHLHLNTPLCFLRPNRIS